MIRTLAAINAASRARKKKTAKPASADVRARPAAGAQQAPAAGAKADD